MLDYEVLPNVPPSSGLQCHRTGRFDVAFSWKLLQQKESLQALRYIYLLLGSPGATLHLWSFWSWSFWSCWPSYNTQTRRGKLRYIIKRGLFITTNCTFHRCEIYSLSKSISDLAQISGMKLHLQKMPDKKQPNLGLVWCSHLVPSYR